MATHSVLQKERSTLDGPSNKHFTVHRVRKTQCHQKQLPKNHIYFDSSERYCGDKNNQFMIISDSKILNSV